MAQDSTGSGIEAVSVFLHRAQDSSIVKTEFTSTTGRYTFDPIKPGSYFVAGRLLGYKPATSAVFEVSGAATAPKLILHGSGTSLTEVVVETRKPLYERLADRTVVNVGANSINAGSNSLEVLSRAPGVTVDANDNIALRGRQGLLVLVDGKRQPMTGQALADFLRGLTADQIERIDLITSPPASLDAQGNAGVIDIRLKKDTRFGTNGSVNLAYGHGYYGKFNPGFTLNHRRKGINLYFQTNEAIRNGFSSLDLHRDFFDGAGAGVGGSDQANYNHIKQRTLNGRAGIDLDLSKSTTASLSVMGQNQNLFMDGESKATVKSVEGALVSQYKSPNYRTQRTPNYAPSLNLKHTFKNKAEWTADMDYARYYNRSIQTLGTIYSYPVQSNGLLTSHQVGDLQIRSGKSDFNTALSATLHTEAGVKASRVSSDNDVLFLLGQPGAQVIDTTRTNRFRYQETILAAYNSYTWKTQRNSVQAGLRYEQTIAHGRQDVGNQGFSRNYKQFFPSLALSRNLTEKHEVTVTLNRRIERPAYNQLNPFRSYIDVTTYGSGNTSLLPSTSYNAEVAHTIKGTYTYSLVYSRTTHPSVQVVQPAPEGGRQVVSTVVNIASADYYGTTVTLPFEPVKGLTLTPYILAYYYQFNGSLVGTKVPKTQPLLNASLQASANLGKGWTADLNGNYQSREVYALFVVKPLGQLALGVQKRVLKGRGQVRLNASDVFYTSVVRATSNYQNYKERFVQKFDARVVTLSFSYRFGNEKMPGKRQGPGGAEDEKRRAA